MLLDNVSKHFFSCRVTNVKFLFKEITKYTESTVNMF